MILKHKFPRIISLKQTD